MSSLFYTLSEKIRKNEPVSAPIAAVLSAATIAVRLGMWARLRTTPVRVDARVISYGNITAGGTGKTPAVIERAKAESAKGRRVGVLTRGYGTSQGHGPVAVDTATCRTPLYVLLGDEPALIGMKCPGVVIVKCGDRVAGARTAIEQCGCDTLILDDGFQHVRLARDENVCIIDAANPFGNGRLIPRGILRENLESIRRATHVILTHCDRASRLDELVRQLKALNASAPIRLTRHVPRSLWRVADGQPLDFAELRRQKISAACAIAAPESFFHTLRSLGAEIERERPFQDHAHLSQDALQGPGLVIVTEKDAVKLSHPPGNVYALSVELDEFTGCDTIGASGGPS